MAQITLPKPRKEPHPEEIELRFLNLKARWESETAHLSSTIEIVMNSNYQQIIGMGQPVIPLLLKDLAQEPKLWFWALHAITGQNPVDPDDAGRVRKMAEAWLAWGRREEYL